jgi:YD repeat-containing protein
MANAVALSAWASRLELRMEMCTCDRLITNCRASDRLPMWPARTTAVRSKLDYSAAVGRRHTTSRFKASARPSRASKPGRRATYFSRVNSTTPFLPLEGDFHGQIAGSGNLTLSMADGSVVQFNSAGKLLSLTDRNGNSTSLRYDINGFLSSLTDPFGRVLTVNTNASGQVTSLNDSRRLRTCLWRQSRAASVTMQTPASLHTMVMALTTAATRRQHCRIATYDGPGTVSSEAGEYRPIL